VYVYLRCSKVRMSNTNMENSVNRKVKSTRRMWIKITCITANHVRDVGL